jgi:thiamine pyrophosphate-dependent acetolactate synthase large subunit-like protein
MNAYEQVSLALVQSAGPLADDEALHIDEQAAATADERAYRALPAVKRFAVDAANYWYQYTAEASTAYANYKVDTRLDDAVKLAAQMTRDECAGKLSKAEKEWLPGLQRGLSKWRETYRQQREAELRAEVAAWERAALARLGKRTVTAEVVAESMPIAA